MIKNCIVKSKSYKNALGEEKRDYQFFLVLENGKTVRIAPYRCNVKGKEWNTFNELMLIAERVKDDEK